MTNDSRETEVDEIPIAKRILIGDPLASTNSDEHLLPKRMALPIFASDALSSVAYGPQEMMMILLTGGLAFLAFSPWIALSVVILLIVIVLSYRQLIKAYPSGGGDYEVARKNLGEIPGVVVAAALLVDYVLTVSVSVASGVDNIISAVPGLNPWRVEKTLPMLRNFQPGRLEKIYARLAEADYSDKSGKADLNIQLDMLVAQICLEK